MLALTIIVGSAHAECATVDLLDRLAELRAAYTREDEAAFSAAAQAVDPALRCLVEPLRRPVAAEWHRAQALVAAVEGGPGARERVVAALAAAWAIDASATLFSGALPDSYWEARHAEAAALPREVARPFEGDVWLDGGPASGHPANLPAVAQCRAGEAVLWTTAVGAGEPIPACAAPPAPRCEHRFSRGASWALAGSGLALAGASVALGFWNADAARAYDAVSAADTPEDLAAARTLTNTTGGGSAGAGVGAGALGLLVTWKGCF